MPQVADVFMLPAAFGRESIDQGVGKRMRRFMEEQLKSAETLRGGIAA
jgi:hypothetical protein